MRAAWIVLALASCSSGASLTAQQPAAAVPSTIQLPKPSRRLLDDAFKRWQLATVDPRALDCRRDGENAPVLVTGDLNGDGNPDIAVAVATRNGVRLVAILARVTGGVVVEMGELGATSAAGYLGLEPRGRAFKTIDDPIGDFFAADTVTVSRCGQPRTAYVWTGTGFRKVVLQ